MISEGANADVDVRLRRTRGETPALPAALASAAGRRLQKRRGKCRHCLLLSRRPQADVYRRAAGNQAAPVSKALVDLESHIQWSAVEEAWKGLRPDWVRATAACNEAACVAAQLVKLEQNVKWKAVDKAWKERRAGWVNDCKAAATESDVAKLLLEFEANVRWRAVDDAWKARRESWVSELKQE
jgi:hypothetical protein